MSGVHGGDILLILAAIIFPPLAVFLVSGCSCDLLISILLTALAYIPGLFHSLYITYKKMEAESRFGPGNIVNLGNGRFEPGQHRYEPVRGQNYGATAA